MMALAIETPQLYYKMSILKRALAVSEGKLARYSHNAKISVHLRPHFDGIMIASSKEVIDLGICLHCNTKVLKLHCGDKAKKYTTTTMLNHLRTDHAIVIDNHRVKKKENIGSDALVGSGFESFDKQLLKECKLIIKKGIAECVIRDGRPFLLPNGEGFEIMGGSFVEVGVRLGKIPNPQVLAALIPKRDATKRFISKRFAKEHARLIGYLKAKDKEILPPINFTFDLWTDAASKNEYIGVCAHEPDPVSKELKHFVLCFWEWEALNAEREASEEKNAQEEREGEEDELNEEEEEAVQRLLNEEQIQELLDSDDEEEEPVDFDENRAYDSEDNKCDHTDIDDSYLGGFDSDVNIDNDNGNGDNNEEEEEDGEDEDIDIEDDDVDTEDDDAFSESDLALNTPVTGDALQANLSYAMTSMGATNISQSEDTNITADQASNNVKAMEQMLMNYIPGVLHGLSNTSGGAIKTITKHKIYDRRLRKYKRNPKYKPFAHKVLTQVQHFSRFTKRRRLNKKKNFDPSLKLSNEIRWNTLTKSLNPFTKSSNWKKFKQIRNYYIQNNKLNKTEKKHYYHEMRSSKGYQLIKQFDDTLSPMTEAYSVLEGDKYPTLHHVVDTCDRMITPYDAVDANGSNIHFDAPFADQEDDLSETKALKKQIRDNLEKKVIAKIQVLHHEAALLCPSLKDRRYFDGYKRGKYCRRNEAIASLKRKVQQHLRKVRQRAEEMRREILNNNDNNNSNNNDNNNNVFNDLLNSNNIDIQEPPQKKRKLNRFLLPRTPIANNRSSRLGAIAEVDEYLREINIDLENVYLHNPLEYWYQPYVIRKYPNLQPIALKILSTPSSSATVERLFSLSGFLTKGRRANLSPPAVRMLCFLKRGKYYIESDDD